MATRSATRGSIEDVPLSPDALVTRMLTAAKECLHTRPADVRRAAALVAAQEAYLGELRTGS